jgi:NitT/TauT family transport system permease protein
MKQQKSVVLKMTTKLKKLPVSFTDLFIPNKVIIKEMHWGVILITALFIYVAWSFWPGLELIPRPFEILQALINLFVNGALFEELSKSVILFFLSTIIMLMIGLPLAYLSRMAAFGPFVDMICTLRYFSLYGITLAFGLIMKDAYAFKISLMVFGMLPYFLTSMVESVKSIPDREFDNARTLRQNEWEALWHVVIVGRRHRAIEILRQNAAIGWMMLAMVEGMSMGQGGVGTMLVKEYRMFRMNEIYAVQFTIFCVGLLSDYGFKVLLLGLCPYKRKENGGVNYEG